MSESARPRVFRRVPLAAGVVLLAALPIVATFTGVLSVPLVGRNPFACWILLLDVVAALALFLLAVEPERRTVRRAIVLTLAVLSLCMVLVFPLTPVFPVGALMGDSYSAAEWLQFARNDVPMLVALLALPLFAVVVSGVASRLARREASSVRGLALTSWVFAAAQFCLTVMTGLEGIREALTIAAALGATEAAAPASGIVGPMVAVGVGLPVLLALIAVLLFRAGRPRDVPNRADSEASHADGEPTLDHVH